MKTGTNVWWKDAANRVQSGVTVSDEADGFVLLAADSPGILKPVSLAKVADLTDKEPEKPKTYQHGTVLDNPIPVDPPKVVYVEKPGTPATA